MKLELLLRRLLGLTRSLGSRFRMGLRNDRPSVAEALSCGGRRLYPDQYRSNYQRYYPWKKTHDRLANKMINERHEAMFREIETFPFCVARRGEKKPIR
ncbi:MAG TPA: hypothetical protein VE999_17105 [Gemmataceae bacterium]|nr:hypothetical protein [Gemmataceae bacterium]